MKRCFSAIILFAFFFLFQSVSSLAQDLTGIWRGRFISESGDEYRLEFQIRQSGSMVVTGVSYSYLDVRFYGKTTMTGNFNKDGQVLGIQEIKTIELKMDAGSFACIMKYKLTYAKSGKEEFLEGTFTSSFEKSKPPFVKKGGDCGGGTVYLRKVPTSDFYIEPFLRPKQDSVIIQPKINPPSIARNTPKPNPGGSRFNPNIKKLQTALGITADGILGPKTLATLKTKIPNFQGTLNPNDSIRINALIKELKKPTTVKKPPVNPPTNRTNATVAKTDTTKKITTQPVIKKPEEKKPVNIPTVLKERENALAQAITVHTNEVTIKLYDNGEIDGDTTSIYVDKKLVLSHQGLTAKPITYTLHFDDDNAEHEVVMVAENLGRIPPNTSLMVITAGDKRYQLQITSTEQKNAMVKFRYEKPQQP